MKSFTPTLTVFLDEGGKTKKDILGGKPRDQEGTETPIHTVYPTEFEPGSQRL